MAVSPRHSTVVRGSGLFAVGLLAWPASLGAQSDQLSSPPVLQFPFQAQSSAPADLSMAAVRATIEISADAALCSVLLARGGEHPSADFELKDCPANLRADVEAGRGILHWASGGKPTQCGSSCFGRPFITEQSERLLPNLRQAQVFGRLRFVVDATFDRSLTYFYSIKFTCDAPNGRQSGRIRVTTEFDDPVIGDPGIVEGILDFFTVGRLSDFVQRKISSSLNRIMPQTVDQGSCTSIGFNSVGPEPKFDSVTWNPAHAAPPTRFSLPIAPTLAPRARVEFIGVRRNSVSPSAGPEDPGIAAQFRIFLNGQRVELPRTLLPPEGGDQPLNLCRTIDMTGWNRLQLLFVNDLGGAVWSQFPANAGFGSGPLRTMTTARTLRQGIGPPPPGGSGPNHPTSRTLREFELRYRIIFLPPPGAVSTVPAHAGPNIVAHPTSASTGNISTPCREI